jgi:pyruvate dehydrogenase E1 component alpha subunit
VFRLPVVFLIQNNQYAISTPLSRQSAAPTLAHRAVGYGMPGRLVDGNDVVAVHQVVGEALAHARSGHGPVLVEAVTYRIGAHTTADDPSRYRSTDEVARWRLLDPIARAERYLRLAGQLTDEDVAVAARAAEEQAQRLRARITAPATADPADLFRNVFEKPTPHLAAQMDGLVRHC